VSVFVVDASLVIKWSIPEIHSEAARRWLDVYDAMYLALARPARHCGDHRRRSVRQ
jgi:predicted nucleic acid-binding protein